MFAGWIGNTSKKFPYSLCGCFHFSPHAVVVVVLLPRRLPRNEKLCSAEKKKQQQQPVNNKAKQASMMMEIQSLGFKFFLFPFLRLLFIPFVWFLICFCRNLLARSFQEGGEGE